MRESFNLSGTLMNRDIELAEFTVQDGVPVKFHCLCNDKKLFPFEMELHQTGGTLVNALLVRIVPETRQGLLEDLAKVGIAGYDLSSILKHQNASSFEDTFWVRFDSGPQTWRELQEKLGFNH